jgi:hypothetical protein
MHKFSTLLRVLSWKLHKQGEPNQPPQARSTNRPSTPKTMFAARAFLRPVKYRFGTFAVALKMQKCTYNTVLTLHTPNLVNPSRDDGFQHRFLSDSSMIRGTVSDGTPSSDESQKNAPGYVTRTLRVLKMDVVRKILDELRSADVNSDGR